MADNKTSSSDSGSDPAGVDITQTEVHRSPYQETGSDDDVSVQSDFAAGVDISYQAAFPGDIDAFLNRRDQEDSDESRDMEIPSRKPSLQGADVNLTPTGVTREPRAARPKARADSRPTKTPKNAAKARGSVGRQVREGRSKWDDPSPPPTAGLASTTQAPWSSQDRSQMAGALGELESPSSAGYPAAPSNPAPSLPRGSSSRKLLVRNLRTSSHPRTSSLPLLCKLRLPCRILRGSHGMPVFQAALSIWRLSMVSRKMPSEALCL